MTTTKMLRHDVWCGRLDDSFATKSRHRTVILCHFNFDVWTFVVVTKIAIINNAMTGEADK